MGRPVYTQKCDSATPRRLAPPLPLLLVAGPRRSTAGSPGSPGSGRCRRASHARLLRARPATRRAARRAAPQRCACTRDPLHAARPASSCSQTSHARARVATVCNGDPGIACTHARPHGGVLWRCGPVERQAWVWGVSRRCAVQGSGGASGRQPGRSGAGRIRAAPGLPKPAGVSAGRVRAHRARLPVPPSGGPPPVLSGRDGTLRPRGQRQAHGAPPPRRGRRACASRRRRGRIASEPGRGSWLRGRPAHVGQRRAMRHAWGRACMPRGVPRTAGVAAVLRRHACCGRGVRGCGARRLRTCGSARTLVAVCCGFGMGVPRVHG